MKKIILLIFTIFSNSFSTPPNPAPPLNLAIPSHTSGHPYITWNANPINPSSPTVYYKVMRLIEGSGYTANGIKRGVWTDIQGIVVIVNDVESVIGTNYTDTRYSIASGEKAQYRVYSVQSGYLSDPTPSVTVGGTPSQPQGVVLSSSVGLHGPIRVSWQQNIDLFVSYEVSRLVMNYPGVWEVVVGSTTSNYWDDPAYLYAPGGGQFTASYRVRAVVFSFYSNYSNIASVQAEDNCKLGGLSSQGEYIGVAEEAPTSYSMNQNFPNPFNPSTMISFAIPNDGSVSLKVYDMVGHEIATLVDGYKSAGRYSVAFDASKLSSGMYIYRIQAGTYSAIKKMQVLK